MSHVLERLFPTLQRKVFVAIMGVLLLTGGAFVFIARQTGFTMIAAQEQTRAHTVATFMKGWFEQAMLAGDHAELPRIFDTAFRNSNIRGIFVLRENGSVAFSAPSPDDPRRIIPPAVLDSMREGGGEQFFSHEEGDSSHGFLLLPVIKSDACYNCHESSEPNRSYFGVKLAMDDLRHLSARHRTMNVLLSLLAFGGLGGIMYLALSLLVIRPIAQLHRHIRRVEGGIGKLESGEPTSFPLLAELRRNDEIAGLCTDFNRLISRLNDANARVYEMHQAQLEQADRLATTGEMAASMAHEIKNPVAGVLGALQVFDSETSEGNPRKEILAEMMIQLGRVNHAVNDLLTYARPTLPVFEPLSLNDCIMKTLSLLTRQVKGQQTKGKGITTCTELAEESGIISADRKQIQQVLWNIFLNAFQSMDLTGGELCISSAVTGSQVTIRVEDTGKGIPPDQLGRIFKPFYTTKHRGTGLGMTISQRIIEQHGGTITVASTVGKGTEVTITLPCTQEKGR